MDAINIRHAIKLHTFALNTAMLNTFSVPTSKKQPTDYGVDNWLWDNGSNMFWDNEGVVLTDK